MRKKKRIRSISAITRGIAAFMLCLWLVSMYCITFAVAQGFYSSLVANHSDFASMLVARGRFDTLPFSEDPQAGGEWTTYPGIMEFRMLETLSGASGPRMFYQNQPDENFSVLRNKGIKYQTAVIFYNKDKNVILQSGDYVYGRYVTEDVWVEGGEESSISGFAYIDLAKQPSTSSTYDPYSILWTAYGGYRPNSWTNQSGLQLLNDLRALRITGFLDGAEIRPAKMSYISQTLYAQALETAGERYPTSHDGEWYTSDDFTLSGLDRMNLLEWQVMFDDTGATDTSDDLITIYMVYPWASLYNNVDAESVKYRGTEYDNLLELLSTTGEGLNFDEGHYALNYTGEYSINRLTVFGERVFSDWTGYDFESGDPPPDPEFIMITAISSRPLIAAISELLYVYIVTFIFAVLGTLYLRRVIKRNLTQPLEDINEGIAGGWTRIASLHTEDTYKWREPYELGEYYKDTQDKLLRNKNELTRLNTSLEYAKKAEENRRQMTSNIAHELKTPLAIIHSYSEGLKEHIADEKREQYLDVILEESEHMDAMLFEMLDLSRLEAGKVKLSRDEFSLAELARSIFDKLNMPSEEKGLNIEYVLDGDCIVTADEVRISQVITNFAVNAVKYTPRGGDVLVKVSSERGKTTFSVENNSEPFSSEELSKVWETFYRADAARSDEGAGLGLAIAKSIIDLHDGKCFARNTKTGVEFGFTI